MSSTSPDLAAVDEVVVRAPSRAHITLIDMNGSTGRRDGSVGFTLADPALELRCRPATAPGCAGVDPDRAARITTEVRRAATALGVPDRVHLDVLADTPGHQGFGSGTQLRLAVLTALAALHGRVLPPAELVALCGRGGTSGIGIHGFQRGGFLVDAGHRAQDKPGFLPSRHATGVTPPELLFAAHPPAHWGVLLAVPRGLSGLEGDRERDFMVANTPVPLPEVQATSHLVLMGLIPAVLEGDVAAFGANLTRIQDVGWKARHWRRPELRAWRSAVDALVGAGATGAGLSSTGALVFGVYDRTRHDDREIAARAAADLTARGLVGRISTTTIGGPASVRIGAAAGALAATTATGVAP